MTHLTGIPIDPSLGARIHWEEGKYRYILSDYFVPKLNERLPQDLKVEAVMAPCFIGKDSEGKEVVLAAAAWPFLDHTVSIETLQDAMGFGQNKSRVEIEEEYIIEPLLEEISSKIISGEIPVRYFYQVAIDLQTDMETSQPLFHFRVRGSI